MIRIFLSICITLFATQGVFSAEWRSSLYQADWIPDATKLFDSDAFIQDYSYTGYHLGNKEIPTVSNNIIDITQPPYSADFSGTNDATAAIQQAIDKVQSDGGGVVFFPEGTYKISPGSNNYCLRITSSNIILRGAGTTKTFIFNNESNMRQKTIISIDGSQSNWYKEGSNVTPFSHDVLGPSKIIPLTTIDTYSVGQWVIVRNTPIKAWATEHKETEWEDASSSLKGILHYRQITAIDSAAQTITIDAPLRYALKVRDNARLYTAPPMAQEIGLEYFSIGNREVVTSESDWLESGSSTKLDDGLHHTEGRGPYNCHGAELIEISGILNSWIRNVSSYKPTVNTFRTHMVSNGIKINQSRAVTLENVSVGFAQYGGGGGNGYGFRIESNDILLINCTAQVTRHGFDFSHMYTHGNVMHQCTDKETGKVTGNSPNNIQSQSSRSDFHMFFSPSCLIDQSTFDKSGFMAIHRKGVGSSPYHNATTAHTTFWNTTGNNSPGGSVIETSQTRYGYVMGTSGSTPGVKYKLGDGGQVFRYDSDASRTLPYDIVEGIGEGTTLVPQSLYLDQLSKRLGMPATEDKETPPNSAPEITVTTPMQNEVTLNQNYTLTIEVEISDADSNFSHTTLFINGDSLRSERIAPYNWGVPESKTPHELNGLPMGTHSLLIEAIDSLGEKSSYELTLNVVDAILMSSSEYSAESTTANSSSHQIKHSSPLSLNESSSSEVHSVNDGLDYVASLPTNSTKPLRIVNYDVTPNKVFIQSSGHDVIEMYSITGEKIVSLQTTAHSFLITDLNSGVYYLILKHKNAISGVGSFYKYP